MLGFVQNFFAPKCSPIGIDFGSDSAAPWLRCKLSTENIA